MTEQEPHIEPPVTENGAIDSTLLDFWRMSRRDFPNETTPIFSYVQYLCAGGE